MGRIYVPSTPATRGEPVEEPESVLPENMTEAEALELLEAAAAELGFRLVPIEADDTGSGDDTGGDGSGDSKPENEPAGNASTEAWATYAKSKGATDDDLKGADGEPMGRDEIRAKFGTPQS